LNVEITVAGKTDRGLVRAGNEDSFKIVRGQNLFIVCDGMGGHQAGEVASNEACITIERCFVEMSNEISGEEALKLPAEFPERGDLLIKSIRIANRSIYTMAVTNINYNGMGTTIVAAALQEDVLNMAHVGDSRIYRMSQDQLVRMTTDHSWVTELKQTGAFTDAEAAEFTNKNVITRALGVRENVEIDFRADHIQAGEIYIFCSDGLCGYAEDNEIFAVANECGSDVNLIVDNLVQLANDHGGQDNVTVIALRIDSVDGKSDLPNIAPVTVSNEEENAILKENEIVDKIRALKKSDATPEDDSPVEPPIETGQEKSNRSHLILILVAFIIVVILIYLSFTK
jgi:serine/threonine protein phosphatase PrpC